MKFKITLLIVLFVFDILMVWLSYLAFIAPYINTLQQHEQVVVAAKRERKLPSGADYYGTRDYDYIVAFKFPDGSVKELDVNIKVSNRNKQREIYDFLHEDERGILTYKERADLEEHIKNEELRWEGRRFISFEKDPEYGGLRLETNEMSEESWLVILIGVGVFVLVLLIVVGIVICKKK